MGVVRTDRAERPAPESLLRLCGLGLAASLLVTLLFLVTHVLPPEGITGILLVIVCFPFPIPGLSVGLFVCFSMGVGILAVGKARSRRAKWIVALAHFTAPVGFAAWLLTLPASWS